MQKKDKPKPQTTGYFPIILVTELLIMTFNHSIMLS